MLCKVLAFGQVAPPGSSACKTTTSTTNTLSKVVKNREQRRQLHTNYVVDSGATLHCINDISLFDSIDHDHPPVKLRVANGNTSRTRGGHGKTETSTTGRFYHRSFAS